MTEVEIITIRDDGEWIPRPTSRPRKRRTSYSSPVHSDDEVILESDWWSRLDTRGGEDDIVVLPPPPREQRRSPQPPPPPSDWEMREDRLRWELSGGTHEDTTLRRRGTSPLGNFGDNEVILLDHSPPSSPPPPPPLQSSSARRTSQAQPSCNLWRRRASKLTTKLGDRVHRGERGEVIF